MDFIADPEFLVILCVIQNCMINHILSQLIDNFNFVKIDKSSIWCSTWNINDCVRLNANFHFNEFFQEGDPEMKPRFCQFGLQNAELFVDSNISLFDLMET